MTRILIVAAAAWYLHCHSVHQVAADFSSTIKQNQQPINEAAQEFRQDIIKMMSQNLHDFRQGLDSDLRKVAQTGR